MAAAVSGRARWRAIALLSWCGHRAIAVIARTRAEAPPRKKFLLLFALAAADPSAYGDELKTALGSIQPATLSSTIGIPGRELPVDWAAVVGPIGDRFEASPDEALAQALVLAVSESQTALRHDPSAESRLAAVIGRMGAAGQAAANVLLRSSDRNIGRMADPWVSQWCTEQRAQNASGLLVDTLPEPAGPTYLWLSLGPRPAVTTWFSGTFAYQPTLYVSAVCPGSPVEAMGYRVGDVLARTEPDEAPRVQRGTSTLLVGTVGAWH